MNDHDRLERLWQTTRPTAPPAEAWDRVWAAVADRLDDPAAPGPALVAPASDAGRGPRLWPAAAGVLIAQAAAILLAVALGPWADGPRTDPAGVSRRATASVRIEEGQLVLIRTDADAVEVADLTPEAVDAWYLVYNLLESMAGPVVAMSE